MTAPQIPLFLDPLPNRTQKRQVFSNNIDNFVNYQPTQITGTNTVATFVNDTAVTVESVANIALTSVTSVNFKGSWSNLTGAIPDPAVDATTVFHGGLYYQALNAIADVTLSEPGVTSDWALSAQSGGRVMITPPLTLVISGRYYINGAGIITIPLPTALPAGAIFDFAKSPSIEPNILVPGVDLITSKVGFDSDIDMDVSELHLTVNNNLWEV